MAVFCHAAICVWHWRCVFKVLRHSAHIITLCLMKWGGLQCLLRTKLGQRNREGGCRCVCVGLGIIHSCVSTKVLVPTLKLYFTLLWKLKHVFIDFFLFNKRSQSCQMLIVVQQNCLKLATFLTFWSKNKQLNLTVHSSP